MTARGALRVGTRAGEPFEFRFEDRAVRAWPGESIAAALTAAGVRAWREGPDGGARGLACGIGTCWECRCVVDGVPNHRACRTVARAGMQVRAQRGLG